MRKKWNFPFRISSVNVIKPQFPADLVTFIKEILNGKQADIYLFKVNN